jgi:hypothetical protein
MRAHEGMGRVSAMSAKDRLAKIGGQVGAVGAAGLDAISRGTAAGKAAVTDVAWIHTAMESVPVPSIPATEPWEMSLAAFLRLRTDLPELALKPLGLLDRYGAVTLGPEVVGFDGEEIPWARVVRIGVREVGLVVTDSALDREAEKIRGLLPPLPGRKWVVERAMEVIGAAAMPLMAGKSAGVACEIAYRTKLGREKILETGLFGALLLASRRPIHESFVATAREHGVPVSPDVVPVPGPVLDAAQSPVQIPAPATAVEIEASTEVPEGD